MIEIRDNTGTGPIILRSYASLFNVPYTIGGGAHKYTERVAAGAFTQSLQGNPDVVFRTEHSNMPLARTKSGTLRVGQDDKGLWYEAKLDRNDPDVISLVPKIRSGNMNESSFAFRCLDDSWDSTRTERTLHQLDIHRGDVSIVTFGASPTTGDHVQMTRSAGPEERRAWTEQISRSGWGGPGAVLMRAGWSNQHGASCESCARSGRCATCDGAGWVPSSSGGSSKLSAGRTNQTRALPPSRLDEFEREFAALNTQAAALDARAARWK